MIKKLENRGSCKNYMLCVCVITQLCVYISIYIMYVQYVCLFVCVYVCINLLCVYGCVCMYVVAMWCSGCVLGSGP